MGSGPVVLCYHAISDRWTDQLSIPAATVERQVRWLLGRGLLPVRAEDAVANRSRCFHITFDDAYRSVSAVLPALELLSVPATIFACTGYAGDGRGLDVPELRGRSAADPRELETMPWEALRELGLRGVEIGSHTVTHAHLPDLADADLERELRESRQRIEEELGHACHYLAYPYGEHDARVRAAARAAGYAAAFTLDAPAGVIDPFGVPRVDVYRRDGGFRFAVKASRLRRPATLLLGLGRRARTA